jgi:multidrug resistance efflux pump
MVTTDAFFGNVRASEISSLSYGARGCVVEVSEDAKREREVQKGQVLVKLDDLRSQLALKTAEGRLAELQAASEERQLALQAALADDRRRNQELGLVSEEFERSSVLMGRGLINESTMDAIERRFMEANFAAERAKEAIANARAAIKRAEIALEIGELDLQSARIDLDDLQLTAPFDGVLVGFDANIGDCVQEGALAGRIYVPDQKSVDVYFRISRLTAPDASGMAIGATVKVKRINGEICDGAITQIDTEADLESQFVEATINVDAACAPSLFLNEAVEVMVVQPAVEDTYSVPESAVLGGNTVFLVDEDALRLVAVDAEVVSRDAGAAIIRIPDATGRLIVADSQPSMADGMGVALTVAD